MPSTAPPAPTKGTHLSRVTAMELALLAAVAAGKIRKGKVLLVMHQGTAGPPNPPCNKCSARLSLPKLTALHLYCATLVLCYTCTAIHVYCATLILRHTCTVLHLYHATPVLHDTCTAIHLSLMYLILRSTSELDATVPYLPVPALASVPPIPACPAPHPAPAPALALLPLSLPLTPTPGHALWTMRLGCPPPLFSPHLPCPRLSEPTQVGIAKSSSRAC